MTTPFESTGGAASDEVPVDVEKLVASRDLIELGVLADARRCLRHGSRVTFVRVQEVTSSDDLHPSSVAGELRIVGGPRSVDEATAVVMRVVAAAGSIPVTAFSLHELAALCSDNAHSLKSLLTDLLGAGLAMICEARADMPRTREWLDVSRDAGVDVASLTVGDPGTDNGIGIARDIATWGASLTHVHAFAPLPRLSNPRATTGYGDARRVALARLLVENIDSIQVDWKVYGAKLSQVALTFGANDVDGVSAVDSLEHGRRRAVAEEIRRNIEGASLVPVQRDGRFETVDG